MREYKVIWSPHEDLPYGGRPQPQEMFIPTQVMNTWSERGWGVLSIAPGTNATTYSGLFITLFRDIPSLSD
jgi:hypothetical protein